MINTTGLLVVSGILVIVGMVISYFLSENEMNEIGMSQQTVPSGSFMNVTKSLDPAKSSDGVYSVKISGFTEGGRCKGKHN